MMASPSSSSREPCKYDVFLSFRGEDTRKIFVSHLYEALKQKAINAYIDSADLEKGNKISELLTAIENSRISIVVLSQDYASSKWCLRELAKIMECMDNKEQIVLPVFYEVDPSDVRNIGGTFAQAYAKHGETSDLGQEELKSWRSALTRVADLSGWDSQRYEEDAKLIKEVVESTFRKLTHTWSDKANRGLVGMDSHIAEMYSRLCLDVNDVRVVAIWGMGGLGKTTIATAVYDEIACQFEHHCFVHNVKEAFKSKREAELQRNFVSDLLKEKVQGMDLRRGRNMIMERLGTRKVLVVLDDVESFSQIEELLGEPHAFGEGSRIIVTTRNKQAIDDDVDETYQPKCLCDKESRELLRKHAFRTKQPSEEYSDLINQAIEYAQGLPLALKVLGSSLYKKSIRQWKDLLEKIKIMPQRRILDLLKTSFDELDNSDKSIFLDIACVFRGWDQDDVTDLLHGFFPHSGIPNLVDRALITISGDNILDMHDLLQELGREIVQRYSIEGPIKEPGKRSRLWSYEDINHVLTQNTATDTIECLVLELPTAAHPYCINIGAFVRMTKLRVLRIYNEGDPLGVHPWYGRKHVTSGVLELLSHELRLLEWHKCPLETLPSSFIPKDLVRLDMRGSRIVELWKENKKQPLQHLKEIWLSDCESLVKIPDLTNAVHLKKLCLDSCSSLSELHPSIFALELEDLTLLDCKQLEILPSSLHMRSLKTLFLSGCSKLEKFPEISDVMLKLQYLALDCTAIKELSSSINNLTGLAFLYLSDCKELTTLPSSIHLSSLCCLDLDGCSNLEKFPEISDVMSKLRRLNLNGTAIKALPSSINNLTGLVYLHLSNCKELTTLPSSIHLSSLCLLDLNGCSNLENFPEISVVMSEIIELHLNGTAIKALPSSINNLTGLAFLYLSDCKELTTLPSSIHLSSLCCLDLDGCSNLEKFPEISGIMEKLPELHLDGTAIKGMPSSIDQLLGLKILTIRDCKCFEFLPDSICNLAYLTHLDLSGCSALHLLPEKLGDLKSLTCLRVEKSGIKHFPLSTVRLYSQLETVSFDGFKDMVAPHLSSWSSLIRYYGFSVLVHLDLSDCNLLELPDSIADLSSLKTLKLCRNNFESLPVTMGRLGCLTRLELEACKRLKSIPELWSPIEYIGAHDCTALENVSKPKPPAFIPTHCSFKFSNCFQLIHTYIFRDIVETNTHLQGDYLRPLRFKICLPGSEVPNWFKNQSEGFSVSVQLSPDWFGNNFLGFAICAVRICRRTNASPLSVACLCTFKGNGSECSFSFDLLDSVFSMDGFYTSDHMFLGYVSWADCYPIIEGKLVKEAYTEVTFEIIVVSDFVTEQLRIKSCGVRFVYAHQDQMLDLNMPLPQVHVDGWFLDAYEWENEEYERVEISREIDLSESSSYRPLSTDGDYMEVQNEGTAQPTIQVEGIGAHFFPEQSEIRMRETEWEAESSESGEGRGTCRTLELLPEPQKESKEEEEIMMVVEQGEVLLEPQTEINEEYEIMVAAVQVEGCQNSGSVCCCLSLSACQTLELLSEPQTEREKEDEIMVVAAQGCQVLGSVCCSLSLSGCTMPVRKRETKREGETVTSFSNDGDVLELPTVGLVVPYSQIEGQEEKELMGEEWLPKRGPFGALCSCFYWVGELWRGTDRSSRTRGLCL